MNPKFEFALTDIWTLIGERLNQLQTTGQITINFHDICGISHVHDTSRKIIEPYSFHNNSFCNQIKSKSEYFSKCVAQKAKVLEVADRRREPFWGTCYMGYEEFVFPVHVNNTMIGVLFIGGLPQESSNFLLIIHDIQNIIFLIENAYHEYQFLLNQKKVPLISEGTLKNEHIVMSTMRFIKEHYSRDLSLNLLASHVYINPSYLSTLFKKVLNIPLSHYINQVRITESLYYLSATHMTITEIAKEVGYNDPAYFSKVFKAIEGMSPLAYRNSTS